MTESEQNLKTKLKNLPDKPGVYLYKNDRGRVIYVGKAKVLKNRVRSYFSQSHQHDPKTASLVSEIVDLDLITTANELEALILENSLIKTERPKYNILLRDDKDWLYIRLTTDEKFPRLMLVRRPDKKDGLVFGPYIPASIARRTKAIAHKYFGIRTCNRDIDGNDPRACLQYDMKRCAGPCISKAAWPAYQQDVGRMMKLLQGKNEELVHELKEAMVDASAAKLYESAAGFRDALEVVQRQREEQRIASTGFEEQDIFAYHVEENKAILLMFAVRNGLVKSRKEFHRDTISKDELANLLALALQQFYHGISFIPKTVIVQHDFEGRQLLEEWLASLKGSKVEILIPQRGKKKSLLELTLENARLSWKNKFTIPDARILSALQDRLGLATLPRHIECFDISTIQGSDTVAGMVCYKDGKPRKGDYRKFTIKTVEGSDDFASMREAVGRRYSRLVREDAPLPDLVLIDGGKGQLSSAIEALAKIGLDQLPVASVAKKEEILYTRENNDGIFLAKTDPALKLIQRIRDETHRYAITFHRNKRSQRTLTTVLKKIPGIGPKRAKQLLTEFGSVERVKNATIEDLATAVGPKMAAELKRYLNDKKSS
jgi:excinuclease ABC subunit C